MDKVKAIEDEMVSICSVSVLSVGRGYLDRCGIGWGWGVHLSCECGWKYCLARTRSGYAFGVMGACQEPIDISQA